MTNSGIGAICGLALTTAVSAAAWFRNGASLAGEGALLPAIVSGVLVPLMLPRFGAKVLRVREGARPAPPLVIERCDPPVATRTVRADDAAGDAVGCDTVSELVRKNARLAQELVEMRAAYTQLMRDAAERAATVDRLHHLAYHDPLTQLPNRALLMDRLAQALSFAQRAGSGVLVMYLDLDNFKTINDTLGHAAGDRVLREIAARISGCMRASDTASRVGGDEFVLVCPTSDAVGDAAQLRARLQAAISAPIDIEGRPVTTGASVGMSLFPTDGRDAADLIHRADQAMYCTKTTGRRR